MRQCLDLGLRAVVLVAIASVAACGGVPPYERGRLAHRTMTTADMASPAEAHTRAIQEGATGGGFEAGGGCGCN
ncbi:MAG TPA: DUF4266 domain-containing protein [Labilithrix sp.]|nr:DUF4266 domain-containing protein [Labilithrix sp.]